MRELLKSALYVGSLIVGLMLMVLAGAIITILITFSNTETIQKKSTPELDSVETHVTTPIIMSTPPPPEVMYKITEHKKVEKPVVKFELDTVIEGKINKEEDTLK